MPRRFAAILVSGALALGLACAPSVARAVSTPTSVTLTWTAPGDDSLTGTASHYDVRYSTAPISAANFANATPASNVPAPLAAGTTQSMLVSGLTPGTAYWFALKTVDDAGNWSGVSNIVQWTTPTVVDAIRPAPLAIQLNASTTTSVTLGWTATGDDSLTGTASNYEVRWSTAPITAANWVGATPVTSGVPAPAAPGTVQGCTVSGLDRSVDLYFAARIGDEAANWSALSNVVTVAHLLDAAPPAVPSGLALARQSDGVHLTWNANTEADLAGYHVYRATASDGPYVRVDASTLASNAYVDASAPDSIALWYEVSAVDASSNESGHSAPVSLGTRNGVIAVRLQPVYPNPSSLSEPVTLPVDVPANGATDGRIQIIDSAGELVRTLELHGLAGGTTSVQWDGRNDSGRITAPGVYRALLKLGGTTQIVRLVRKP